MPATTGLALPWKALGDRSRALLGADDLVGSQRLVKAQTQTPHRDYEGEGDPKK